MLSIGKEAEDLAFASSAPSPYEGLTVQDNRATSSYTSSYAEFNDNIR